MMMDAIRKMAKRLSEGDLNGGNPLCGKCGQEHDPRYSECPAKYCLMCGTTHKPNEPFHFNNCERNERFARWYASHLKWVEENTKEIWSQPDKDEDNDD